MCRGITLIAFFGGLAALATPAPSEAFWPRSQLMACAEAASEADYLRWRCRELDGFGEYPNPFGREFGPPSRDGQYWRPRRGSVVRRLG